MTTYDITLHKKNESFALIEADLAVAHDIHDHFSFFVPGYQFQPKYKYGAWDGKIKLFKIASKLLPIGLTGSALDKFATRHGYSINRDHFDSETPCRMSEEQIRAWITSKEIYAQGERITPFWYQTDSVIWALHRGRGILNLPTSAGKSLVQGLLCKWQDEFLAIETGKISLLIVPTVGLVSQMKADLLDYELFTSDDIYAISGGVSKSVPGQAKVVVSTWQSIRALPAEWFMQFDLLLLDEAHLATGKSISDIVEKKMTQCIMKFGLTGTVKKAKANVMQLVGHFGDVYKPITTSEMQAEGKASKLKITSLEIVYPKDTAKACRRLKYPQEIDWLINNKQRNAVIASMAVKKSRDSNENCLILINHIDHGEELLEMCRKKYGPGHEKKVFLINGGTKKDVREKLRLLAEKTSGLIFVAGSGIMSTGTSIRNLHTAIFGHPTKSEVRTLQSVGRTLRKHKSKDYAEVIDIIDNLCVEGKTKTHMNYSYKHGVARLKMYFEEKFDVVRKRLSL